MINNPAEELKKEDGLDLKKTQSPKEPPLLPDVLVTLKEAWVFYKKRFKVLTVVASIPYLIFIVFVFFFSLLAGIGLKDFFEPHSLALFGAIGQNFLPLLLVLFVLGLVHFWSYLALIFVVKEGEREVGVVEAYTETRGKVFSYWWLMILSWIVTLGGLMLFIVPGIIVSIWIAFGAYILVVENLKGMDALQKSREYVRGHWGAIFWRFFFIALFLSVITAVYTSIQAMLKYPFWLYSLDIVFLILSTPLTVIYGFLIYTGVKNSKQQMESPSASSSWKSFGLFFGAGILVSFFFLFVLVSVLSEERIMRDIDRSSDLFAIQVGLLEYRDERGEYPASLSDLMPYFLDSVPSDPKTSTPYQYQLLGTNNFKLCAEYELIEMECVSASSSKKTLR